MKYKHTYHIYVQMQGHIMWYFNCEWYDTTYFFIALRIENMEVIPFEGIAVECIYIYR